MTDAEYQPITISRRIGVPASVIFPILADAGTHRGFDGTGMLRGVVSGTAFTPALPAVFKVTVPGTLIALPQRPRRWLTTNAWPWTWPPV